MTQTWITAIIGVVTVLGAYLAARLQRPRIEAEAQQIIGETYRGLINELQTQIDTIKTELEWERTRNYQLVAWSKALAAQVVEHGGTPVEYEDFRR